MCQGAQEEIPRGRIPAEAHPASNTTQARQAWKLSTQAGEPSKTILDQSHGDDRLPARRVGTDIERQHLKGAFARESQQDGLEKWRRALVSQIVPTDRALMVSEARLQVSRVTSPFKAATTAIAIAVGTLLLVAVRD